MKRIVFLASGGGGNLKFFHQAILYGHIQDIQLSVIADRTCGAIEYAARHGIQHRVIHYSRTTPSELTESLDAGMSDIIITNWHKIIDVNTVRRYTGKLVNLHYSLLPAFGGFIGINPIKRAYEQGCKFIGPTCHLVDEDVDTGKIVAQAVFTTDRPIEEAITMMFRKGCLVLLNGVQTLLGENLTAQRGVSKDMYSPTLNFDENIFDEDFWHVVAQA